MGSEKASNEVDEVPVHLRRAASFCKVRPLRGESEEQRLGRHARRLSRGNKRPAVSKRPRRAALGEWPLVPPCYRGWSKPQSVPVLLSPRDEHLLLWRANGRENALRDME